VEKQKKLAQNAQRESNFKWDDMGTINKAQGGGAAQQEK